MSSGDILLTDSLPTAQFDDVESLIWPAGCGATLLQPGVVTPGVESTLVFPGGRNHPLKIRLPAAALAEETTLAYTELTLTDLGPNFGRQAFRLNAYRNGLHLEVLNFEQPVSLSITYDETSLGGLDERGLVLRQWDRAQKQWHEAACGDVERRPAKNELTVPICHLTEFGLFAGPVQQQRQDMFLPLISNGE